MIERLQEQQLPINGVLLPCRDLTHLVLSPADWRVLYSVLEILKPFKIATEYFSGETYPTGAAIGPLLSKIINNLTDSSNDCGAVKAFKKILKDDLDTRYTHPTMKSLLNKSSFLDPRFKGLTHLSQLQRDEVVDSIVAEAVECKLEKTEDWAIQNNESIEISPLNPKRKKSALLVLFGDEYESNQSLETGSSLPTSADDIVRAEVLKYKSEPSIPLGEQSEYCGKGQTLLS